MRQQSRRRRPRRDRALRSTARTGIVLAVGALLCHLPAPADQTATHEPCPTTPVSEVIRFESSVGEVVFGHALHFEDLGLSCEQCHHETHAAGLSMPHQSYFEDFWIDCATCHTEDSSPTCPQACGSCHHGSPVSIADESLSSKVVIHESCWGCHETGTGAAASSSCQFCHTGPASRLSPTAPDAGSPEESEEAL